MTNDDTTNMTNNDMTNDDMTNDPGNHADSGDTADEELLQELRAVVSRVDPVPLEMVAAAKAGFIWHTIDAELAQLTSDSVLNGDRMAAVRGVATPELLIFECAGLTVEVETASGVDGLRLLGQLVPAQRGRVEIRHRGGTTTVDADDLGRFTASGLQPGPVSLRCRTEVGGRSVDTDWFLTQ